MSSKAPGIFIMGTSNQKVGGSNPSGGAFSYKSPPRFVKIRRKNGLILQFAHGLFFLR